MENQPKSREMATFAKKYSIVNRHTARKFVVTTFALPCQSGGGFYWMLQ